MNVFIEGRVTEEQQEALENALTEILADVTPELIVNLNIVENAAQPLPKAGSWVYLRLGVRVSA